MGLRDTLIDILKELKRNIPASMVDDDDTVTEIDFNAIVTSIKLLTDALSAHASASPEIPPQSFSYFRMPGMPLPWVEYPATNSTEWIALHETYQGVFLRMKGGNASRFQEQSVHVVYDRSLQGEGGGQEDSIEEHTHRYTDRRGEIRAMYPGTQVNAIDYETYPREQSRVSRLASGRKGFETRSLNVTIEIYFYTPSSVGSLPPELAAIIEAIQASFPSELTQGRAVSDVQYNNIVRVIQLLTQALELESQYPLAAIPDHYTYLRFPGRRAPWNIYSHTSEQQWKHQHALYPGCMMRMAGGNASAFLAAPSQVQFDERIHGTGGGQAHALENHTHEYIERSGVTVNMHVGVSGSSNQREYFIDAYDVSDLMSVVGSNSETHSKNITVEVYTYEAHTHAANVSTQLDGIIRRLAQSCPDHALRDELVLMSNFNAIIASLALLRDALIIRSSHPSDIPWVGFAYIRFPTMQLPWESYPETSVSQWIAVHELYPGAFWRLAGGNASAFKEDSSSVQYDSNIQGSGGGQNDMALDHYHTYTDIYGTALRMTKKSDAAGWVFRNYEVNAAEKIRTSEPVIRAATDSETRDRNITIECYIYKGC